MTKYFTFRSLQIVSNTRLTPQNCTDAIHLLQLAPTDSSKCLLPFNCGQYVRVLPATTSSFSYKTTQISPAYFALASAPEVANKEGYSLLIKSAGEVAVHLCQATIGEHILVEAPQGKGFAINLCNSRDVFLLGVGTGIAPLRSVWQYMQKQRQNFGHIAIYVGFLTPQHILLVDELHALKGDNIDVHITVSNINDDWSGYVGFVQHVLRNHQPNGSNAVACLAGMRAMTDACTTTLLELGFDKQYILLNY